MGLDTTHDCWHGSYGSFSIFREKLAEAAGIPLDLMEGFYSEPYSESMEWLAPREGGPLCGDVRGTLIHAWIERHVTKWAPIAWESLKSDVLHVLLDHSDYDGDIPAEQCAPLADRLEELLPNVGDGAGNWPVGIWRERTQTFIDGLRLAASRGEAVEFH